MIANKDFIALDEGRYTGLLYHITSFQSLIDILKSDTIKVGVTGAISFTRNKNFLTKPSGSIILSGVGVMISLDVEKLTNKYKVEPYNYHGLDVHVGDEMEERVLKRNISSVKNLIKEITLYETYFPEDNRSLILLKRKMDLGLDDNVDVVSYAKFIDDEFNIKCRIINR